MQNHAAKSSLDQPDLTLLQTHEQEINAPWCKPLSLGVVFFSSAPFVADLIDVLSVLSQNITSHFAEFLAETAEYFYNSLLKYLPQNHIPVVIKEFSLIVI